MKRYTKPVLKVTVIENTSVITLSGVNPNAQITLNTSREAMALGLNK